MPKPQSPVGAGMISWSHMPLWLLCISLCCQKNLALLIRKVACLEMQRLSAFGGVLGRCGRASHGSSNWEHSSNRGAVVQKIKLAGNVREQSSTGGWMDLQLCAQLLRLKKAS